jgi:hypothetical protein
MTVQRLVGKHRVQPVRRFRLVEQGYHALFGPFGAPLTRSQRNMLARWVKARRRMGKRYVLDRDRCFEYTSRDATDVRATFARIRLKQRFAARRAEHFEDSPYWIDRRGDVVREQQP